MTDMLELAARCEAATGPDFELDTAISNAILGPPSHAAFPGGARSKTPFYPVPGEPNRASPTPCAFTAAVECAEHALPGPEWPEYQITRRYCTGYHASIGTAPAGVGCETAALALCVAALRSRAALPKVLEKGNYILDSRNTFGMQRLASLFSAAIGRRLTYVELIA